MLETDCPYLAPVPHRGKCFAPNYLKEVEAKVPGVKVVSAAELGDLRHRPRLFPRFDRPFRLKTPG